jgi:DNA helicase-2/ATP-dependent DNA helicase PcrA
MQRIAVRAAARGQRWHPDIEQNHRSDSLRSIRSATKLASRLLDEDYLILSTIHSAKGQEWKSVFLLNVVDGCIPSDLGAGTTEEPEEERRLLYVAMTRAKDDLHLIIPQRFFVHGQSMQGDRHLYASRTRFISEAPLPLFERIGWPVSAETVGRVASQGPRIVTRASMREGGR